MNKSISSILEGLKSKIPGREDLGNTIKLSEIQNRVQIILKSTAQTMPLKAALNRIANSETTDQAISAIGDLETKFQEFALSKRLLDLKDKLRESLAEQSQKNSEQSASAVQPEIVSESTEVEALSSQTEVITEKLEKPTKVAIKVKTTKNRSQKSE